jgi:hypothetical protein
VSTHGFQAPGAGGGSAVRPRGSTAGTASGRTAAGRTSSARPSSARPSARRSATRRPPARGGAASVGGRRRLVGAVLVLAVLVALGTAAGYGVGRGVQAVRDLWPDPVPGLEAQKVAAPEPAEVGGPSRPCPASSLTLGLTPNHTQADVGEPFAFVVTITNSGRRPCIVDGSGVNRRITVADAAGQTVWTSAHCTSGERQLLLGPGDVDSKTIRWSGKGSVAGGCTTGQAAVPAGTYTAQVSVASVEGAVGAPVTLTIGDPVVPSPAPSVASSPSAAPPPAG